MSGPSIPVGPCQEVLPNNSNGYRRETREGYRTYSHRWAYCDNIGLHPSEIEDKVILHLCDNPRCVNTKHLRLGTTLDNVKDMDQKGRRVNKCYSGDEHPNANLSREIVNKIQEEYDGVYGGQKALSVKYSVPTTTINRIVNKKGRFKHGA